MKRPFNQFFLTVGLSILGSLSLSAQSHLAMAKIPFDFQVQGRTMPPGLYTVGKAGSSSTFQVSDWHGHSLFMGTSIQQPGDPADPKVTFTCYGKECILSSISMPGSSVKYALSPKQIESNLTRKLGVASMISVGLGGR
jgi:hypothetical protein